MTWVCEAVWKWHGNLWWIEVWNYVARAGGRASYLVGRRAGGAVGRAAGGKSRIIIWWTCIYGHAYKYNKSSHQSNGWHPTNKTRTNMYAPNIQAHCSPIKQARQNDKSTQSMQLFIRLSCQQCWMGLPTNKVNVSGQDYDFWQPMCYHSLFVCDCMRLADNCNLLSDDREGCDLKWYRRLLVFWIGPRAYTVDRN